MKAFALGLLDPVGLVRSGCLVLSSWFVLQFGWNRVIPACAVFAISLGVLISIK